jgi:hypothetical protein
MGMEENKSIQTIHIRPSFANLQGQIQNIEH